jgi:drug/metabolite transporter (DMT)-like permease
MRAGSFLALASAMAFGATVPFVQRLGRGVGPFATAALLYGGAAFFSAFPRRQRAGSLRGSDGSRLLAVAALGAVVAPALLAWGLQRSSGVVASLLLNLEAIFTALLARAVWAESIGWRVGFALVVMTGGGILLVAGGSPSSTAAGWGSLAVVGATCAWAGDNVLGRPLADRDPARVVFVKGMLGAVASAFLALAFGEPWPAPLAAGALVACGASGYGASLTLYLLAQRRIGAARTGSIFAAAPFIGAVIAWAMGERAPGPLIIAAGALFSVGVCLHLTEVHEHEHEHEPEDHSHAHSHDDRHHDHPHSAYPKGEHTHPHRHDGVTHSHSHGMDVHHRHHH